MDDDSALSPDQQLAALRAPQAPLGFLIDPVRRTQRPGGFEEFSDSAVFHRLHDLLWTLGEPPVWALLEDAEKAALAEFDEAFNSLPWRVIESHPHISELADDDLTPLIPAGARLYHLLEAHEKQL